MRRSFSVLVVLGLIAIFCQSTAASQVSSPPLVAEMTVLSPAVGPQASMAQPSKQVVLPIGQKVSDEELDTIKGEGFWAAVEAGIAGAIGGAVSYTVDYVWDKYIDDAIESWLGENDTEGDTDNYRSWEWNEFYGSAFETAAEAFFGGLFIPSW